MTTDLIIPPGAVPEVIAGQPLRQTAPAPDVIALLLANKQSAATRRAYAGDLADFFRAGDSGGPAPAAVQSFLQGATSEIALRLAVYKGEMLARGLAEATVNRRLAAVRSLLKFAHRIGGSVTDGRGLVDGEKVQSYRDTRGVDLKTLKRLVGLPAELHGDTLRGLRDAALLRLLGENALRRAEVCALDVGDFSLSEMRLQIIGKGRGTQKAPITLSPKCAGALAAYLVTAGHAADSAGPLFQSLDRRPGHKGARLTPNGLYGLIGDYGRRLGLDLTPHKLRHSAITAALDAGGTVREVQKLSRHAKLETLQRYDDSRADHQGKMSQLLSGLL